MLEEYQAEAIVLNRRDRREADRLFTVFTDKYGKIELLAKGERKILSKLRAGIELFYWTEISFIKGKRNYILTTTKAKDSFSSFSRDWQKLQTAQKIVTSLDLLLPLEFIDESIFVLIRESLSQLAGAKNQNQRFYHFFLWSLLKQLGDHPPLDRCVYCQSCSASFYHMAPQIGLVCPECFRNKRDITGERIDLETIKILRLILEGEKEIFRKLKISQKNQENLIKISQKHLDFFSLRQRSFAV